MIAEHLFWPYLVASLVCIASPGPDSLSVLSIGLARGRREAMQFALGVGTGCLTHTLWAALGVAAVVAASENLFTAIKLAGAAYLLWLGVGAVGVPGGVFNFGWAGDGCKFCPQVGCNCAGVGRD